MSKLHNVKLMQGNEACARGAIAAGASFYAGYPITPSTEIAEYASEHLPRLGRYFIQMEDEIASMGAIIGAAAVGHKAFTATSGPGFSLMQELIGFAAISELPLVVIDVMRAGPSTGLPTLPSQSDVMQARYGTHGDHSIIAISPNSVTEAYYQTIRAFNLAQQYRTPVVFLMDEKIGHLRERFDVDLDAPVELYQAPTPELTDGKYLPFANTESQVPPFIPQGQHERYHITGLTHNQAGFYTSKPQEVTDFIERLSNKIEQHAAEICEYEEFMTADAEVLLIAYGSVSRTAQEAILELRASGLKVGLLRLITIWPFCAAKVAQLAADKRAVIVPEMNLGQVAGEVKKYAGTTPVVPLCRVDGDLISPDQIVRAVKEVY